MVSLAHARLRNEQQTAHRLKQTIPKGRLAVLRADIADAVANVTSVVAAFEAYCEYPPLKVA